jgi:hypothetical protein
MYGFLPDDRVIFKYVTPITGERRILLGTIYSPKEKKVLLDSSQLPGQDSSGAFYVVPSFAPNLLTISQVGLAQGTQVSFNPINRRGNYFEGTVVSTTSDYDVWVELSPAYVDQWYGENQPHGNRIVHVPSYRIRKLE